MKFNCDIHKIQDAFTCRECMKAAKNRHDRMLKFIQSLSNHFNLNESEAHFIQYYVDREHEAQTILKEFERY